MPTKQQLRDAMGDITILSDVATDALENLIEEYGDSFDEMECQACNEAESQLWADEDCFSYLEDNNITEWIEAVKDGCSDVNGIAKFYLEKELIDVVERFRHIDYDLDYPEESEEEGE